MQLNATTTGSTSIRLTWDPTQQPSSTFTVWRSLDSNFAHAAAISSALLPGSPWYNDYTVSLATAYWYWLVDQNAVQTGPATATTAALILNQDALDETQMAALASWANGVYGGLYATLWRYQATPAPQPPRIILNDLLIAPSGRDDAMDPLGESLVGGRVVTISVQVATPSAPVVRTLLNVTAVASGTYTVTINGTPFTVTYGSAPANATAIINDLQALLAATGLFKLSQYGTDPANQGLIIEPFDQVTVLTTTVTGSLATSSYTPPKAMTIAQRLWASLGADAVTDPLSAAGIGVGQRHGIQDLSGMLDTEAQLVAQFDFYINVAEVYPVTGPVIDTAQAPTGAFTY